jgi:hypothetical protein
MKKARLNVEKGTLDNLQENVGIHIVENKINIIGKGSELRLRLDPLPEPWRKLIEPEPEPWLIKPELVHIP